jgi:hypothetical protein
MPLFPFTLYGQSRSSAGGGGGVIANTLCADFGGGYLEAPDAADFSFTGNVGGASYSFSLWVYLGTTAGSQTLISKFGGIDGYVLSIDSDELNFSIWDQPVNPPTYPNGCWFQTATAGDPITGLDTNKWQHIVAIFDNVSLNPCLSRIYINGVDTNAVVNAVYKQMAGNAYTATKFRLGSRGAGTGPILFGGKMDEVSIWSKALSALEVKAIFDAGITPTTADLTGESGLESWYRFKSTDNFTGTAGGIVDELGNANLTSSPSGVVSAAV